MTYTIQLFSQPRVEPRIVWASGVKSVARSFKTPSDPAAHIINAPQARCGTPPAVSCRVQRALITVTCRRLVTRLSEQMFPAPIAPSAPFVGATTANPLLLNMLPEADGCRPKNSINSQPNGFSYMWFTGGLLLNVFLYFSLLVYSTFQDQYCFCIKVRSRISVLSTSSSTHPSPSLTGKDHV